jgi:hypothetical protein
MSPEEFRQAAASRHRTPGAPIDVVRDLFHAFLYDADSLGEVERVLGELASVNARVVDEGLSALQALLDNPPAEPTLTHLVAVDANLRLADATDAGALAWLREVEQMLRRVHDAHAGGRS